MALKWIIQGYKKAISGFLVLEKYWVISTNFKIQMYIALVQPIELYASETWSFRNAKETKLNVFEKRILRKFYGPCIDTHTREWQKRHNHELEKQFQKLNVANEILKRKLTWAKNAWRKIGSIVITTIEENPVSKRLLGRPRLLKRLSERGCSHRK